MSINPLNDISKVYLEQVSVASRARNAVADDRLDAEQEKTNASMNRLRLQSNSNRVARADAEAAARRVERGVNNSSAYGPQRPKPGTVTGRRIEDPKPTGSKPKGYRVEENEIDEAQKPNDGNLANNYPPYDKITRGDVIAGRLGKDEMGGKKKKSKGVKEGFSNWRQDLSEVMGDIEDNKQVKEKKNINNKVKTSAMGGGIKLGEAVDEIGGTLLEMVEIDEVDFIVESVYDELLEEGYDEDDIEEAIEYALIEATVTYGHDTNKPYQHKKKTGAGQLVRAVGRLARQKLTSKVRDVKKSANAAAIRGARKVAKGALGVARKLEGGDKAPKTAERKPSTYRGAGVGTKERVSSGSYTPPTKKKAEKPADPWEGSVTTPPKAKAKSNKKVKSTNPVTKDASKERKNVKSVAKPATTTTNQRKKKTSELDKLDSLLADIRSESVGIDEDAGIISGLAGLALGARGASYAAKHSKRMRDYPKNFVKGIVDPRTYVSKKKKDQKEEIEIDEKMNLATADMADVIRDFETSNAPQFKGRTKEQRRQMAIAAKLTAERGGKKLGEQMDDSTEMSSTSPVDNKKLEQEKKKIQLQKIKDLTIRLAGARKGVY